MVRSDDTLLPAPEEQALFAGLRLTSRGRDEVGIVYHNSSTLISIDVNERWIFQTELIIEYTRRRDRQIALSLLWERLNRLVHPELVDRVRIIQERGVHRARFEHSLLPVVAHEAVVNSMGRSRNNSSTPTHLDPPQLVRQVAGEIHHLNGRSPRFSQLGSSHGEKTESDDLASAADAYNARVRRAREAATNRHRSTPGSRSRPVAFGSTAPPTRSPLGVDVETRLYIVRSEIEGALYTADGRTHFIGECSGDFTFVDPLDAGGNTQGIMVLKAGHGWYQIDVDESKNKTPYVLQPATREVEVPAYRSKDKDGVMVAYPGRRYVVYEPLLSKIRAFLPMDSPDEAYRKAVSALRTKMDVDCDGEELLVSTGQYAIASMHYLDSLGNDNDVAQRCRGARSVGAMHAMRESSYGILGISTDVYVSRKVAARACTMVNDWEIREDIQVLRSEGVVDENGAPIPEGRLQARPYWTGLDTKRPFESTNYFSFQAPNLAPFVEYDRSNESLARGVKRLMGARDEERQLRSNNLSLGEKLRDVLCLRNFSCVSIGVKCKDVCDGLWAPDVSNIHDKLRADRRIVDIDPGDSECHEFVAENIATLVGNCDRTRLQKFVDSFLSCARWGYLALVLGFLTVFRAFVSRQACSEIPHIKMKLRDRYVKANLFSFGKTMVGKNDIISINLKRETAKDGKAPRVTADYKAGCMYANELPEYVKVCLDGEEVYQLGEYTLVVYIVAKPKSDSLEKAFARLDRYWRSSRIIYAVVYSDDMCISGLGEAYNVDISSCDTGQDVSAFLAMYASMRRFHREHSEGLIDQCMLPMDIVGADGQARLRIKFRGPFLGSGTVLTTPLNHFASAMIALGALFWVNRGMTLEEAVRTGAASVGHKVTVETVEFLEDFQFLKRSCTKILATTDCHGNAHHKYVVFTNRACMLRNLGKIWNVIEPRHLGMSAIEFNLLTTAERADRFFSCVMAGWQLEPTCPIVEALRRRFSSEVPRGFEVTPDSNKYVFTENNDYRAYDVGDAVIRRYRLSAAAVDELVAKIDRVQLGNQCVAQALENIYSKDYGVGTYSWDEHELGLVEDSLTREERVVWHS